MSEPIDNTSNEPAPAGAWNVRGFTPATEATLFDPRKYSWGPNVRFIRDDGVRQPIERELG